MNMNKRIMLSERQQHFGFRKYVGIGLCSVALASFVLAGKTNVVSADTVKEPEQEQEVQKADSVVSEQPEQSTAKQTEEKSNVTEEKQNDNHTSEAGIATSSVNKNVEQSTVSSPVEENKNTQNTSDQVQKKCTKSSRAN